MLSNAQLLEVVATATVGLVVLIILYFAAPFILSHITWILSIAIVGAATAIYLFSRRDN